MLVLPQNGALVTNGVEMRNKLGLLSPNFRLGVLRLERPVGVAPAGSPVRLTGIARGVEEPTVEELAAEGLIGPNVLRPEDEPDLLDRRAASDRPAT